MLARRPAATSRWLPSMRALLPSDSVSRATPSDAEFDSGYPRALVEGDAFIVQALAHDLHQLRVVLRQQRRHLDERDRGAQAAEGLRQFDADRAAADDEQVARTFDQIEDRLVREVRHMLEAGQRRQQRGRAGGDDEAARADGELAGSDLALPREARWRTQHAHAEAGEALLQIMRSDGGDDAVDVSVDSAEVDRGLVGLHAEAAGMPLRLGGVASGQQGFRGHAAVVQAVAAHLVGLDQHGLGAQLGGAGGHAEAGRAGADDADVGGQSRGHEGMAATLRRAGAVALNHRGTEPQRLTEKKGNAGKRG